MSTLLGIGFILFGLVLFATREVSAQLHERWNTRFRWTQWATGPWYMQASRIANIVVGIALVGIGSGFLIAAVAS
jgi:hypothetical protein